MAYDDEEESSSDGSGSYDAGSYGAIDGGGGGSSGSIDTSDETSDGEFTPEDLTHVILASALGGHRIAHHDLTHQVATRMRQQRQYQQRGQQQQQRQQQPRGQQQLGPMYGAQPQGQPQGGGGPQPVQPQGAGFIPEQTNSPPVGPGFGVEQSVGPGEIGVSDLGTGPNKEAMTDVQVGPGVKAAVPLSQTPAGQQVGNTNLGVLQSVLHVLQGAPEDLKAKILTKLTGIPFSPNSSMQLQQALIRHQDAQAALKETTRYHDMQSADKNALAYQNVVGEMNSLSRTLQNMMPSDPEYKGLVSQYKDAAQQAQQMRQDLQGKAKPPATKQAKGEQPYTDDILSEIQGIGKGKVSTPGQKAKPKFRITELPSAR